jgi:hypothetical protein
VRASDNVMVTRVRVKVFDQDGKVLEEGRAYQVDPIRDPECWEYASSRQGAVEASAWDLAGNEVRLVCSE